jgi:hypothetical protein
MNADEVAPRWRVALLAFTRRGIDLHELREVAAHPQALLDGIAVQCESISGDMEMAHGGLADFFREY